MKHESAENEATDVSGDAHSDADSNPRHADTELGFVDRHLAKILIAAAVICAMGLAGRALTG